LAGPISEENFFEWEALISGPVDTVFEGGLFSAKLVFPTDYPLNPPKVKIIPYVMPNHALKLLFLDELPM
jgi:ubiquitin-protein ligase